MRCSVSPPESVHEIAIANNTNTILMKTTMMILDSTMTILMMMMIMKKRITQSISVSIVLLNSLDQSGFLFLNEYFCKLVTSQHNFIPSLTKEGFCCCCRVSFFVCIKKKTKRKAGRIKRNVRGKFSCPISWNMFTKGILIWVLEREGTMYSNFIFYTPTKTSPHTYTLSYPQHIIFVFIHSMLLHNYILFNVPFPFFFLLCVCMLHVVKCSRVHMSEKGHMKKVSFFCIMIWKSVMMILLLWVLKCWKCNNPAEDYVNDK